MCAVHSVACISRNLKHLSFDADAPSSCFFGFNLHLASVAALHLSLSGPCVDDLAPNTRPVTRLAKQSWTELRTKLRPRTDVIIPIAPIQSLLD